MKMRWPFKLSVLVVAVLAMLAIIWTLNKAPFSRGLLLRQSLLNEISNAKVIRVIEHSNRSDDPAWRNRWDDPVWLRKPYPYVEKIYKVVILDPSQVAQLRKALFPSVDYSAEMKVQCFQPHHRIEILRTDHSVLSIEICFECGNLDIQRRGDRIMPVGWKESLRSFVSSLSLHPDGPFP